MSKMYQRVFTRGLSTLICIWTIAGAVDALPLEFNFRAPYTSIAAQKRMPLSATRKSSSRLTLRGGGVPVIPIVAAAAAAIALKTNEGLRSRVMDVLSHVSFGQNTRRRPQRRQAPKKANAVKEEKVVRAPIKSGYDLYNGTWAYEVDQVEPGCLLVASPDTFRFAGHRQLLDQSVVLLMRHGPAGSSGFIINRPTQYTVGDVTKKLEHFDNNPLYVGGDIGEGVYMIHGFPNMANATEVSEGVYYGGSDEAMALLESGKATPDNFRFFFKYTAWVPGQLEAEIQAGCWCAVRTSLDLILQPREYKKLHIAKYHKVFWHQVLQTLGGRFQNISEETILKEDAERLKLEEWVQVLNDGGANVTVENHEGIELGALAMATVTNEMEISDIEAVHNTIEGIAETVKPALKGEMSAKEAIEALNAVFFQKFTVSNSPEDLMTEAEQPNTLLIHEVVKRGRGTALALSPLYMACARQIGLPLRATNCSSQMRSPVDFIMRWDERREGKDSSAPPIFVDLAQQGKIFEMNGALEQLLQGAGSEADLNAVPHVQLYSRFMHRLADAHSGAGEEQMVLAWLAQLRVLQGAINTRIIQMSEAAEAEMLSANVLELLGNTLQGKDGMAVPIQDLKDKFVALYFSASWCAPCKAFTPKLIETYNHLKETNKPFEVVFVSSDRAQEAFDKYYGEMPWLTVPFPDQERRGRLGASLGVDSIPKLVILRPDGSILTTEGRAVIMQEAPHLDNFPWSDVAAPKHDAEEQAPAESS